MRWWAGSPAVVLAYKQREFKTAICAIADVFVRNPRRSLGADFLLHNACEKHVWSCVWTAHVQLRRNDAASCSRTCGFSLSVTRRHIILQAKALSTALNQFPKPPQKPTLARARKSFKTARAPALQADTCGGGPSAGCKMELKVGI